MVGTDIISMEFMHIGLASHSKKHHGYAHDTTNLLSQDAFGSIHYSCIVCKPLAQISWEAL